MLFNSLTFIVFFLIVLSLYRLPISWRAKKAVLLAASYIFYAAWNPFFVVLIWISTTVDFTVSRWMGRTEEQGPRLRLLLISLVVNLGLLSYFKYGGFLLDNFTAMMAFFNVKYQPPAWDIVLPVGISFYTFQTLSYTIDVYRRKMEAWNSFLDYALYVTFFPQLVAGPIVRSSDFLPQCLEERRATAQQMGWGLSLLTIGIFQKTILADFFLAPVVDTVYAGAHAANTLEAWMGALGFSAQIFFDFTGYSTCAIGVGMCLGFALPDNFRFPYASLGFRDFWRRWHISLSTWLRDYLYISLGGNRKGKARTYVNIMLTMLLGGLWHGASWRFVVWGGLHGGLLVAERVARRWLGGLSIWRTLGARIVLCAFTYFMVCVAWVFFRAQDFDSALSLVAAMFTGGAGGIGLESSDLIRVLGVNAYVLGSHWLLRDSSLEEAAARVPWWVRSVVLLIMIIAVIFKPGDNRAFIYFQF